MGALATAFRARRWSLVKAEPAAEETADGRKRGFGILPTTSLDVESSEPEFVFDSAGDVVEARAVPQTESHRLIEMLMILANEQVAQLLERKRVPAIYRVHAQPDPPRVPCQRVGDHRARLWVPPCLQERTTQEQLPLFAISSALQGGFGQCDALGIVSRHKLPLRFCQIRRGCRRRSQDQQHYA